MGIVHRRRRVVFAVLLVNGIILPILFHLMIPGTIHFAIATVKKNTNWILDNPPLTRNAHGKQEQINSNIRLQHPETPDHAPVVALVTGEDVVPSNSPRAILCISPPYWLNDWIGNTRWESSKVFRNCPLSNCYLTSNKRLINKADAVLFRVKDLDFCRVKRKRGQIWILFEYEAPTMFPVFNNVLFKKCYRNVFNWTMTYRRDSDFLLIPTQFSKSNGYHEADLDVLLMSKKRSTVGFISHCHAISGRDDYIQELRSYGVKIGIYGDCGKFKCVGGDRWKAAWNATSNVKNNCFNVLDSQYKFYLSFENALCVDYVTEKSLHLVLRHKIVPIIRDASNRTLYHPPKSYLDTKDFKDAASLAARIQQLESNMTEYKEYHAWRKHYTAETVGGVVQTELCNMCQRLHNPEKYRRVYGDIVQFYKTRRLGSPNCHLANDIKP